MRVIIVFGCLLVLLILSLAPPRLFRYKHVVVDESPKLKVIERSTESLASNGKPLSGRVIGLPTKSVLRGSGYAVTIYTPLTSRPVVFLRADDEMNGTLNLRGAHLSELDKKSGMAILGYRYSFIVDEANGIPMDFDVVTEQGVVLGHEKIRYDKVSRGYHWESGAY